jgi:hypothetical protein
MVSDQRGDGEVEYVVQRGLLYNEAARCRVHCLLDASTGNGGGVVITPIQFGSTTLPMTGAPNVGRALLASMVLLGLGAGCFVMARQQRAR